MKARHYSFMTTLAVPHVAETFKSAIMSLSGYKARQLEWSFREPNARNNPFAGILEAGRQPDFEVDAVYCLKDKRFGGQTYRQMQLSSFGALCLAVSDHGHLRKVDLLHDGTMSPASKASCKQVLGAFSAADHSVKIASGKVRY